MLPITILRSLVLALIGMVLYGILLFTIGMYENSYLKKRKRQRKHQDSNTDKRIFLIYSYVLMVGVILLFLALTFKITGI